MQTKVKTEPRNWTLLFAQSKANGADYFGDYLPAQPWSWPRSTWLQRRRAELAEIDLFKQINRIHDELLRNQRNLDLDSKRALYQNLWELYT